LKNGGIKNTTMNIKAILGLASVALLLVTIYEQNDAINLKKDQIIKLKAQNDSLFKANDTLYSNYWALKSYIDIKEGKAEE
jgi:hypothetical protein